MTGHKEAAACSVVPLPTFISSSLDTHTHTTHTHTRTWIQGSLADCYEFKVSESQWSIVFTKGPVKPAPRYGHSMVETFRPGVVLLYGGAGAGFFGTFLFAMHSRLYYRRVATFAPLHLKLFPLDLFAFWP